MSQPKLTKNEAQILEESINSDTKTIDLRLRKGEYQYDLAREIASFQLELHFPDVKEITEKLYGEKKTDEARFVRKIQTILKKMEKSNIITILPKKKPWELQRYALSSFRFQDVDKNLITLATPKQIKQTQNLLNSILNPQKVPTAKASYIQIQIWILAFLIIISYIAVLWALTQPTINPIVFVPAFYVAVACSLTLGRLLSQK